MIQKVRTNAVIRYKVRGKWTTIRIENAKIDFIEWINEQEVIKDIRAKKVK